VWPELFRLTPTNNRRTLKLNRPIYRRTASYGHFGRAPDKDGGFSWEKTDLVDALNSAVYSRRHSGALATASEPGIPIHHFEIPGSPLLGDPE
jgi:hypothetical protein